MIKAEISYPNPKYRKFPEEPAFSILHTCLENIPKIGEGITIDGIEGVAPVEVDIILHYHNADGSLDHILIMTRSVKLKVVKVIYPNPKRPKNAPLDHPETPNCYVLLDHIPPEGSAIVIENEDPNSEGWIFYTETPTYGFRAGGYGHPVSIEVMARARKEERQKS